jgi:hypothetical protein
MKYLTYGALLRFSEAMPGGLYGNLQHVRSF